MADTTYTAIADAGPLTASTTQTILGVKSNAAFGVSLIKAALGFDASAAAAGIKVNLNYCTWATNAPGTNSTSVTPAQISGRLLTHGVTAARTWTTEPTALTLIGPLTLQQSGLYVWAEPLGFEPDCALGEGFCITVVTPAAVTPSYRAALNWKRC